MSFESVSLRARGGEYGFEIRRELRRLPCDRGTVRRDPGACVALNTFHRSNHTNARSKGFDSRSYSGGRISPLHVVNVGHVHICKEGEEGVHILSRENG